jgi:kynurenine formamidase
MVMGIAIKGSKVIDLSQAISPEIPVPVGFPAPRLDTLLSQEKGDVANVEILTVGVHAGTHVDAPYHFFSDLQRVDALPPDCLIGPAIVVDVTDVEGSTAIEAEDLRRWESTAGEAIRPDDIVLLHTGHSKNWRRGAAASAYWESGWPHLARSAVDYLASKPIRALGVESFDPDWVDLDDLTSAEFPTHRTFLPKGILVIENLTNLDLIPNARCYLIALPLKIEGASGSPLRVVAIV